jgi:hypothetical protein
MLLHLILAVGMLVLGMLIFTTFLFWPFVVGGLWTQLAASEIWWVRMLTLLTLTALAVGLYLSRRWARTPYGLSEFLVGFAAAWKTLGIAPSMQSELATTLALAGCVYLMIRGIDNLVEGWDDFRDSVARSISS